MVPAHSITVSILIKYNKAYTYFIFSIHHMKKAYFCAMLLLIANISFAQPIEPTIAPTSQDYLKKSKTQKTFAIILLSGGAFVLLRTVVSAGATSTVNSIASAFGSKPKKHSYTVPLLISAVSIGASIALFSAASHNKRNAAGASAYLNLKMENFPILQSDQVMTSSYPSVSLTICL